MAQKLQKLDGKAYAREIGESAYDGDDEFLSVDTFLYARCCVVANGREFFERVLRDPHAMPKDNEFEMLLSIPEVAYGRKNKGRHYPHTHTPDYETFSNDDGWKR